MIFFTAIAVPSLRTVSGIIGFSRDLFTCCAQGTVKHNTCFSSSIRLWYMSILLVIGFLQKNQSFVD